jgi:hypothetical protein
MINIGIHHRIHVGVLTHRPGDSPAHPAIHGKAFVLLILGGIEESLHPGDESYAITAIRTWLTIAGKRPAKDLHLGGAGAVLHAENFPAPAHLATEKTPRLGLYLKW